MMEDNENINNDDLMNSSMFSADAGGGNDDFGSIFAEQAPENSVSDDAGAPIAEPTAEAKEAETAQNEAKEEIKPEAKSVFIEEEPEEEEKKEEEVEKEPLQVIDDGDDDETDEDDDNAAKDVVTVRPVKFKKFEATPPIRTIKKNLDIMQDVSMHISVELGRTKLSIKEVMDFEEGSIVELNKIAGEQVEVFVNGKLVAKGEVIVIEDRFGVRVTSTNVSKNTVSP